MRPTDVTIKGSNLSAFGEISTVIPHPTVQAQFPYNINTEIVDVVVTNSGSVTQSENKARISSGVTTNSTADMFSHDVLRYNPGQGALVRFTALFTEGVAGTTQLMGVGDANDGFFFGFNGAEFGILRRHGGEDNWTPQTEWNGINFLGIGSHKELILDVTKGNVYQIRYQWLGFGAISFYIENPATGAFELCHIVQYANTTTETSVHNPTFPICALVDNSATTSDVVIETSSFVGFTEGDISNSASALLKSVDNSKTITSETSILTIRSKATYQSATNRTQSHPIFLSISNDGTKDVVFRVYLDSTLGGAPSYNDVSTNTSPVDFDIAGTTVTGGVKVFSLVLAKNTSKEINMTEFFIFLHRTETLTITAQSTSSTVASVALTWRDHF